MGKLIYTAIASLDGCTEDPSGNFEWAAPDEEVHAFVNELERPIGTYLYGRRMYETMAYWEVQPLDGPSPAANDYTRIWQSADKIVFSRTLQSPTTACTTIETGFDPAEVAAMKRTSSQDLTIGGPTLAAHALTAGLVDELQLFVVPAIVGGGKPWLPPDLRLDLRQIECRRFPRSGFLFLRYLPI